jgi:type II secretory pathway pseudopilin PulG
MKLYLRKQAFTLIETIIILAILGTIAGAVIGMMIEFHSMSEDAIFREYHQTLNRATTQFYVSEGRRARGFGEFMAATQATIDPANGVTVPLMYTKTGEPICGSTVPGPTVRTLVCDDIGTQKKKATYTLDEHVVLMNIQDK